MSTTTITCPAFCAIDHDAHPDEQAHQEAIGSVSVSPTSALGLSLGQAFDGSAPYLQLMLEHDSYLHDPAVARKCSELLRSGAGALEMALLAPTAEADAVAYAEMVEASRIPGSPCPSWCTLGDEYGHSSYHQGDVITGGVEDAETAISLVADVDEDGTTGIAKVDINSGNYPIDSPTAVRDLAARLLRAADLLEEAQRGQG